MNDADRKILADRVAAAKLAKDVLDMVQADLTGSHSRRRFVEALQQGLGVGETRPSSEAAGESLSHLGGYRLPFGKYGNSPLCEVPLDYLDWLVGVQEDTLRAVRAYLKHPIIAKKLKESQSDE